MAKHGACCVGQSFEPKNPNFVRQLLVIGHINMAADSWELKLDKVSVTGEQIIGNSKVFAAWIVQAKYGF